MTGSYDILRAFSGEPIVAPATPRGKSAIAIVRASGEGIIDVFQRAIAPSKDLRQIAPNRAVVIDFAIGDFSDRAVVVVYRAPKSYTGEDMVELFVHGNPVLVDMVVRACIEHGARMAMPGEFTLRAVAHGKMSLADAELVNQTIEAPTRRALVAVKRAGRENQTLRSAKDKLWKLLVEFSAALEFPEDEVSPKQREQWLTQIREVSSDLKEYLSRAKTSRVLREGVYVAIAGEPNVGKSTLFNRIVGAERAIVSPHPGTTRDVIEATVEIDGVPVVVADTAGIHDASHPVEVEGIRRAHNTLADADLVVWVVDGTSETPKPPPKGIENLVVVINKADLGVSPEVEQKFPGAIKISALTGEGFDDLVEKIKSAWADIPEQAVIVPIRIEMLVGEALDYLAQADDALQNDFWDVAQVAIEGADLALGKIFDETDKDIYAEIFDKFCIGK